MITVVALEPSSTALRALLNQQWLSSDEIIVVAKPGSETEIGARALAATGAPVRIEAPALEQRLPPWDPFITWFKAASNDWVWALPPEAIPAPRSVEDIHFALNNRNDAKIHLFRVYNSQSQLLPSHPSREVIIPRQIALQCAVVPRGLAQLAQFHAGQWGDISWLHEVASLHPSGSDAIVWHNRLIATRDYDRPVLERRLHESKFPFSPPAETHDHWAFTPSEFTGHKEAPCAYMGIDEVDSAVTGWIAIQSAWDGKGFRLPLLKFSLEAASGLPVSLVLGTESSIKLSPDVSAAYKAAGFTVSGNTASHKGLCALWRPDEVPLDA